MHDANMKIMGTMLSLLVREVITELWTVNMKLFPECSPPNAIISLAIWPFQF